ncbi:MAG: calcineurin-like phosphoesterase family protein, partial [Planctomycetota bacterium]|nr:calcineurin-like phosphoesterase family protein [Planctomycetota bacterium]
MRREWIISGLTVALLACCVIVGDRFNSSVASSPTVTARGVVFHDENGNRQFDVGETPLPNVRVSNGVDIVLTADDGRYELPVTDDTAIFVIKPSGYRTPLSDDMLPQFYYIHKPEGSPELKFPGVAPTGELPPSVDFPLTAQDEPEQFQAIFFGDPQPRNQKEVDYIAHDVIEEMIGIDAAFGVTLGDIAFDDLGTMEPLNRTIALLGIPWYNVIGNHDINYDARNRRYANESFERIYGPSYYSFDYGPTHFLVLDDIKWKVDEASGKGSYTGGFDADQIAFIKRDLELIPEDQLVVLMMHIPLIDVEDRQEVYRLIENRPFCMSISGHEHIQEHHFITEKDGWRGPQPHHHIINVTACGSWWGGAPDERGIPHTLMRDGAPNGYSLLVFDGHDYRFEFVPVGRPRDYQMQIYAPEVVATGKLAETEILVNVFSGSARSTVELRIGDGEWITLTKREIPDPAYEAIVARETELLELKKGAWTALPKVINSSHIWSGMLPSELSAGTHAIEVRETDMFGAV